MTVSNKLTGFLTAVCKSDSVNHVVKAALKKAEKVFTGNALGFVCLFKVALELTLKNPVVSLCLLLLAELKTVFLYILSSCAMLTGNVRALLKSALSGKAAVAFKKELGSFSAAESAHRSSISCHVIFPPAVFEPLNSSAFRRSASVVRNGSNVLDHLNGKACRRKCADRGFSSGPRTLDIDLNGLHAVVNSELCCGFRCALSRKGSGLSRTLETEFAGGSPRYSVACHIGYRYDRIVEGCLDMDLTLFNVFTLAAFSYDFLSRIRLCCH